MPDDHYATAATGLPWVAGISALTGYSLKSTAGAVPGMTWTAPADGVAHRVVVSANLAVTGLLNA